MIMKKAQLAAAGIALGVVGVLAVALFIYVNSLKSSIASEKKRADAAETSLAACEISRGNLLGAIANQNESIAQAKAESDQMRARQREAREVAQAAQREAEDAIALMRRERAEVHTCEEVRQLLIEEAAR